MQETDNTDKPVSFRIPKDEKMNLKKRTQHLKELTGAKSISTTKLVRVGLRLALAKTDDQLIKELKKIL
jgi:hypothetical protein